MNDGSSAVDEMGRFRVHLNGQTLGAPGTPDTLRKLLAGLSAASVVQSAAKVVHHLEQPGSYLDREVQLGLLELFPHQMHDTLREMLEVGGARGGIDVLFHRQQMLGLQKVALAAGIPGPPSSLEPVETWALIKAAAQVNDIADSYTSGWMEAAQVMPTRDVALWKLRNVTMSRNVYYLAEAGRARRLWVDSRVAWPDDVEHPEAYAQRRFGCDLDMVLAITAAPAFSAMRGSQERDPAQAVFEPGAYFAPTAVAEASARAVLDAMTYRPGGPSVLDDEATYYGWADVAARPYMPAGVELLTVASPALAFVRATTGIFWMLHAELAGSDRLPGLTEHFGHMFEDYILRLTEQVASNRLHVCGEVVYDRGRRRSSDVLVCQLGPRRHARVFVEAATVRPRQAVFENADTAAFNDYVNDLAAKLGQLDRSITHHVQGRFQIEGDPLDGEPAYLPVLVVDEPFTWSPELRDLLEDRPDVAGMFRQQMATKPVVCSVGEYESLIHHLERGGDLVETLLGYLMGDRSVPLEMHLDQLTDVDLDVPRYVREGFPEMADRWIEVLQLPEDQP